MTTAYALDERDRIIQKEEQMAHGFHMRATYVYEADRLIEVQNAGTNPDGAQWVRSTKYSFDEHGRCVREQESGPGGSISRTRKFDYTVGGGWIEIAPAGTSICLELGDESVACYGSDGLAYAAYAPTGAPLSITVRGRFGRTVGKVLVESDELGRVTCVQNYTRPATYGASVPRRWLKPFLPVLIWIANGFLNNWIRWNLARAGEWRKLFNSIRWPPLFDETKTRYDDHGRLLEQRHIMGVKFMTTTTCTYDSEGREIERHVRDSEAGTLAVDRHSYRFNERGHWVERKTTRAEAGCPRPSDTTTRWIEYQD